MLTVSEKLIVKRLRTILQCFVPYRKRVCCPAKDGVRHEVVLPKYARYTRRYRVFFRWIHGEHDDNATDTPPRIQYEIQAIHPADMGTIPVRMTETYRFRKHAGDLVFNVCKKNRSPRDHPLQWSVTQKMHGCAIQYVMFELRTALVQTLIESIMSVYCPRGFGIKCEFISTGTDVPSMTLHSDYDMTLNALHKTSHLIAVYHRILKKLFKGRTSIEVLDNNLFGHSFMQTHMQCRPQKEKQCQKSQVIAPHWHCVSIGPREFVVPCVRDAYQYCREQESWALLRFFIHVREWLNHRQASAGRMSARHTSRKVFQGSRTRNAKTALAWSRALDDLRAITIWPRLHVDIREKKDTHADEADSTCREHLDTAEKFHQANTLTFAAKKYVERMNVYEKLRYNIEVATAANAHRRRKAPVHPRQFSVLSHMNYFGDETYFSAAPLLHVVGMMMLMGERSTKRAKTALVKAADGSVMWDSFLHSMVENASYWISHVLNNSSMQAFRSMPVPQMRREMLFRHAKYLLRFFDALWMHSSFRPCTSTRAQSALKALVELLRYIKKEIYNRSNTVIQLRLKVSDCEKYKQKIYKKVFSQVASVTGSVRPPNYSILWLVRTVCRLLNERCAMASTKGSLLPTEIPKLCQPVLLHAERQLPDMRRTRASVTRRRRDGAAK